MGVQGGNLSKYFLVKCMGRGGSWPSIIFLLARSHDQAHFNKMVVVLTWMVFLLQKPVKDAVPLPLSLLCQQSSAREILILKTRSRESSNEEGKVYSGPSCCLSSTTCSPFQGEKVAILVPSSERFTNFTDPFSLSFNEARLIIISRQGKLAPTGCLKSNAKKQ